LVMSVFCSVGKSSLGWFLMACLLALPKAVASAQESEASDAKPKVSGKPLSAEQLAIYREILKDWQDDGKHRVNLSVQTIPPEKDSGDCAKTAHLESIDPLQVHRFRNEELGQLGSDKIVLVDPEAQRKEVAVNDPGKAIRNGKSVDEAVNNGFAHGLVTLGEIRFDEKRELAIVWYGFTCGSLCGNGGTLVFEKKNGVWHRKSSCSTWVSKLGDSPFSFDLSAPVKIDRIWN